MSSLVVVGAGPGLGAASRSAMLRSGRLRHAALAGSGEPAAPGRGADGSGRSVEVLGADVADERALTDAIDRIEAGGTPDLVVYNAALVRRDRPGDLSHDEHAYAWTVNVVGAITIAARLLPRMAEQGAGTFLLTGGLPQADSEWTSLSLGKAGLRALTSLLADEYTDQGVHVATVVVAGAVAAATPFDPDLVAREYLRLHLQRSTDWEHEVVFRGGPTGLG